MYAIVEIAGQQIKVTKDQQIFVNRLDNEVGKSVSFDKVMLVDDNGKVNVGAPVIAGASITAKVLEHLKGDKVIVFKKKRRKGYKVRNGYRPYLTQIQIEHVSLSGASKKAEKAKVAPEQKEVAEPETKSEN